MHQLPHRGRFGREIGGFGEEEVYATENTAWKSPELIRGKSPSFASDIYAFGISILEAVMLDSLRPKGDYIDIMMEIRRGLLPSRPKDVDPSTWEMAKKMCAFDPTERVKVAYVVQQLEILASRKPSDSPEYPAEPSSVNLRTCVMPTLGATIECTLQAMRMVADRFLES